MAGILEDKEQGKRYIDNSLLALLEAIIYNHVDFDWYKGEGSVDIKKHMAKFVFDNYGEDFINNLVNDIQSEFVDKCAGHFTLLTFYTKDGQNCTEWHCANTLVDALKYAQYNAREEYRYNEPTFAIFNNWSGEVYDHDWIHDTIAQYVECVISPTGTITDESTWNERSNAVQAFNNSAKRTEDAHKDRTISIADIRPHDHYIMQEEIRLDDGGKYIIQLYVDYSREKLNIISNSSKDMKDDVPLNKAPEIVEES